MAQDKTNLVILGVVAIVAVLALVLLFKGEGLGGSSNPCPSEYIEYDARVWGSVACDATAESANGKSRFCCKP